MVSSSCVFEERRRRESRSICERRVCRHRRLLEVEKNGRLHEKGIRRMVSSSCEFEERRRKESRSIFFMVSFSNRRNLYEWKKKRNKRNYVGIKENIMQEDETLQLKIIFLPKKKTNSRNGPRPRLIVYPASKQCW